MNKYFYKISNKILLSLYPTIEVTKYLNPFFKLVVKLERKNGLLYTIKYLKQLRLHCTRYICNQPLKENKMCIGLDSSGWPKLLNFLKPLVSGSIAEKKLLLTILTLSRAMIADTKTIKKLELDPNFDSITERCNSTKIIPTGFIKEFVKKFNLKDSKPEFSMKDVYLSNKSGPNGKSTLTAM